MSELTEERWAVLSERGCEAMGLTYAEALELMRSRARDRVRGLAIVTDVAARRTQPLREGKSKKVKEKLRPH